jgi:hypothetical protein
LLVTSEGTLAVILSSFHLPVLGATGAHLLDDPTDLSCKDRTGQHAMDDPLLSCKQQVRALI